MNNRSQDIKDKRKENMVAVGVTWSRTWWPSIFKCTELKLNSSIPPTSYQVDASYQLQGTGYKLLAPVTTNSVPLVFSWSRTRWPKLGTLEHYQAEGGGRGNCCLIRGSIRTRIPENTFREREPFFRVLPIFWGKENNNSILRSLGQLCDADINPT